MSGMKKTHQTLIKPAFGGPLAKYNPAWKAVTKVHDKIDKGVSSEGEAPPPGTPLYGGIYQTGLPSAWQTNAPVPATSKPGRMTPEQLNVALTALLGGQSGATPVTSRLAAISGGASQPGALTQR